ncbi:MAG: PAC2 family protein [Phycisphaerales bacterium]|nr:PAC2 family protein [Phycisphaerales bacterium]
MMDANTKRNEAKRKPWLVAAWPGMGNVGAIAAGYLVAKLGMRPIAELTSVDHFDVGGVNVTGGLIAPSRLPRNVFYEWKNPGGGRDLVVFMGETQPAAGGYGFAHAMLEKAAELGVERIVTFASMASSVHPSKPARVVGAATGETTAADLREAGVDLLGDGQIGGLNGVLVGVGAARGLPGMVLMGEIPFFAAGVPNPKAARAVLSVFAVLAGVEIDLSELDGHAKKMEHAIGRLLDRLREEQAQRGEEAEGMSLPDDPAEFRTDDQTPEAQEPAPSGMDPATVNRIELLFQEARRERATAARLKKELDDLGVFDQYEDRFLDLFRR